MRANRGAAGVDDETIAMFEQNLSENLYKLWNRLSSGSYFPPPVKQVEIPKAKGGTRKLGIPTVSDRVARNRCQAHDRADSRSDIPSGFLWIPTWKIGKAGDCRDARALLEIRLGY